VCHAEFRETIGVILVSTSRTHSGFFCRNCADRIFIRATVTSALLGWWSGPGLFQTPGCIAWNIRARKKFDRDLLQPNDASSAPASDRLPWRHLMNEMATTGISQVAITWPIGIGFIAALSFGLGLFIVAALAITIGNNTPQEARTLRLWGLTGIVAGLPILIGCWRWHRWRHPRREEVSDLLAELFPSRAIYQLRCLQVAGLAFQSGLHIRVVIALENLSAEPVAVSGSLTGEGAVPALTADLAPDEVALFLIDVPITIINGTIFPTSDITLLLKRPPRRSGLARHAVRGELRSETRNTLVTAGLAIGGHFHWESGSRGGKGLQFMRATGTFQLHLEPPAATRSPVNPQWRKLRLGNRQDISKLNDAVEGVLRSFN
jgi:hypothetical protein